MLLYGCSVMIEASEKIKNPNCSEVQKYKIFQTLDKGALAHECYYDWDFLKTSCDGMLVYILEPDFEKFYDDKIVKFEKDMCLSKVGVYKYITTKDIEKTVPKLEFVDYEILNPKYNK